MNDLFEKTDNTKLTLFRIVFGVLVAIYCWGAMATGWVEQTFVEVPVTFNFIGFEWTYFLIGKTMYGVFALMGVLGLLITIGFLYRISSVLLWFLFGLTFFMQKSNYTDYSYLMLWSCFFMAIVPANRYYSVDSALDLKKYSEVTDKWVILIFKIQVALYYFFSGIAKFSANWLEGDFMRISLEKAIPQYAESHYFQWLVPFLQNLELPSVLSLAVILFNIVVIPLLVFKPTRIIAVCLALVIHSILSFVVKVETFPSVLLAMMIFFFDTETIRNWTFPFKGRGLIPAKIKQRKYYRSIVTSSFAFLLLLQIYLPLRHYLIPGEVEWTAEGARLAWRANTVHRTGQIEFKVELPPQYPPVKENLNETLPSHQAAMLAVQPDFIWQYVQRLKEKYQQKGYDSIRVYAIKSKISLNGGAFLPYISATTNLAKQKWSYFGHQPWILAKPQNKTVNNN